MIDPMHADMTVALFADALGSAVDGSALLREWSRRYPELAGEFAALAADREFGERPVDESALASQTEMMTRLLAEAAMVPMRADAGDAHPPAVRPATIAAAAAERGLAYPADLARRLRLPVSIVERIVGRRIPTRTLPSVLVDRMAETLSATRADVLGWLGNSTPGPRIAALVVSEEKAPYGAPASFADVIANAPDVDEVDRAYWASVVAISRTVGEAD